METKQRIQNQRIKSISDEFEKLNLIRSKITGSQNNNINSIKCLGTGDRLNIESLKKKGNPSGKYSLYLNNGCLAFNDDKDYNILGCQAHDMSQHFVINQIDNYEQYNQVLDKINDGSKRLVFENDDIIYPFKLVNPIDNRGQCLLFNEDTKDSEGGISIEPCKDTPNQRFRTSVLNSPRSCKQVLGNNIPSNNNPN